MYTWSLNNQLTPHPGKSKAMLLSTGDPMDPIAPLFIGGSNLRSATKTRLLGMTVNHKLTWAPHVLDIKKSFVTKLDLSKRSKFFPTKGLRDIYLKVILPSVT